MSASTDLLTPLSHLQAVCENATVALFVMDDRQHCVYMNGAAEQLTGYALAEVQGRPLHEFVHHTRPDGTPYPLADCPIDRAAPQNMQEQGEEVFVHRDGHFYPVTFTASPIRREGRVVGTVIEVREVAREKQRESENIAMRELGELMLDELDLGRMVQAVTDTATRLTGAHFGAFFYNVSDDSGGMLTLYALSGVDPSHFARFPHPRATPLFGPTFKGEGSIRIGDVSCDPRYGQWGPHHGMPEGHLPVRSYLAVPVMADSGEVLGALFFGHGEPDRFSSHHQRVTESLAAQASVGMSRLRLLRAAETQAHENERLYREAQAASEMKDLFLATISHELRTPLTSILGWSGMLASGRLSPDMVQRAVTTIDRNARAQAQIIGDLLDISRIISGKLHLNTRTFDIATPVEAAIEAVRPAALARDVQLVLDTDAGGISLQGDPDRLQQVVWNLLTNAVKFTDRGGRVTVVVAREADAALIEVGDNGRGIAADFLPHVFDRFTQVDATSTREQGGLGLGLSIVRHLVEMHGGYVQANSAGLGQGSTFRVTLPLAAATAEPLPGGDTSPRAANDAEPPDSLAGYRVMLVEDDPDTRLMLASVLEAHGASVQACALAADALACVDDFAPMVVVSDIGMPGMDGYAFLRTLHAHQAQAGQGPVPAIALTAYAGADDRQRALDAGFRRHVAKPTQPSELVALVRTLREPVARTG